MTEFTWKWHKFLCYFALWVHAAVNTVGGLILFGSSGNHFQELMTVMGLGSMAVAVLATAAAVCLITDKWTGVTLLKVLYVFDLMTFLIIFFASGSSPILTQAVVCLLLLIFNTDYYNKRKDCFDTAGDRTGTGEEAKAPKAAFSRSVSTVLGGCCLMYQGFNAWLMTGEDTGRILIPLLLFAAAFFVLLRNPKAFAFACLACFAVSVYQYFFADLYDVYIFSRIPRMLLRYPRLLSGLIFTFIPLFASLIVLNAKHAKLHLILTFTALLAYFIHYCVTLDSPFIPYATLAHYGSIILGIGLSARSLYKGMNEEPYGW